MLQQEATLSIMKTQQSMRMTSMLPQMNFTIGIMQQLVRIALMLQQEVFS